MLWKSQHFYCSRFSFFCYIFSTWNESRKLFQVKQIRSLFWRQSPHGWHWKDANDSHITSCECECVWVFFEYFRSCLVEPLHSIHSLYFVIFLATTIVASFPHITRLSISDAFKLYSYSRLILPLNQLCIQIAVKVQNFKFNYVSCFTFVCSKSKMNCARSSRKWRRSMCRRTSIPIRINKCQLDAKSSTWIPRKVSEENTDNSKTGKNI